jgi:hypothetical protein
LACFMGDPYLPLRANGIGWRELNWPSLDSPR